MNLAILPYISALIVVNLVLSIKYEKGWDALLMPECIIEHSWNILHAQNLLKEQENQSGLSETELTKIKKKGFIVLDYGEELCGGIRIATFLTEEYK